MSNFNCKECKAPIIDSPSGYVTGCEHYPITASDCSECGNQISSSYGIRNPGTDVCQGCHEMNMWDRPANKWMEAE